MSYVNLSKRNLSTDNIENSIASAIHKCQTNNATQLWIFDPVQKLATNGTFDICGTYINEEPELWFYLTSSACPGGNRLLNLFFVHRKVGDVIIGVSDSNNLGKPEKGKVSLPSTLEYFSFKTTKTNENHYLKTYNLPSMATILKDNEGNPKFVDTLVIPINVSTGSQLTVNTDVINYIKHNHFKDLFNKMGQSDYSLQCLSGRQFKVHKVVLASQSTVFREIMSNRPTLARIDVNEEDMALLIEFLYNNITEELNEDKAQRLSDMAKEFQLTK